MEKLKDRLGSAKSSASAPANPAAAGTADKVVTPSGAIATMAEVGIPPCLRLDGDANFSCEFQPLTGRSIVMPYHHFGYCEGTAYADELRVYFWSHDVTIRGRGLRAVKDAIMAATNFTLTAQPKEYEKHFKDGETFVWEIVAKLKKQKGEGKSADEPAVGEGEPE